MHVWTFDCSISFFGKNLRVMGNTLFFVCNENPKVTEGLANLHTGFKEIRDQASQLITVSQRHFIKIDFQTKDDVT